MFHSLNHNNYKLSQESLSNKKNNQSNDNIENKDQKIAGLDIGLNNIANLFVNDDKTQSVVISGKELISYNCHFNKRLAEINENIAKEVYLISITIN